MKKKSLKKQRKKQKKEKKIAFKKTKQNAKKQKNSTAFHYGLHSKKLIKKKNQKKICVNPSNPKPVL
jgi:hypothetical protein